MDHETMLLAWASLHGNCAVNGIPEDVYSSFCSPHLKGSNIRFKNGRFQSRKSTKYNLNEAPRNWDLQVIMDFDDVVLEMMPTDVCELCVQDQGNLGDIL